MTKIAGKYLVVVRGGGDQATGTIHKLTRSGFACVVLELEQPSSIRRSVSFSECVYEGECIIEGIKSVRCTTMTEIECAIKSGHVPVIPDSKGLFLKENRPFAFVEATVSKKNKVNWREFSDLTIGMGPGFTAGVDVDYVIETMRGHNLGRIITEGQALANTGVPGVIAGHSADRVVYAPCRGKFIGVNKIGDIVRAGEPIAYVEHDGERTPMLATIDGLLRGILPDEFEVKRERFKSADIDPRVSEYNNCFTISDKARCLAGSVLEIVMCYLANDKVVLANVETSTNKVIPANAGIQENGYLNKKNHDRELFQA
jgi:xanthine dehydrogenase accessory factor